MHEFHGFSGKDRIYRIWVAMRQRCAKTYRSNYAEYGGRGIRVCPEWDGSFIAFKAWADANGYAANLSIDRIDTNGDYTPANCRWATPKEQADNQRSACVVTVGGVTKTVAQWALDEGFHLTTLYRRYHKGVRGEEFLAPSKPRAPAITVEQIRSGSAVHGIV